MSQTEVHVGKLLKIDTTSYQTVESWCKEYCIRNGIQMRSYYESYEECFSNECSKEFIICNNNVYKIIKNMECDGDDIYHASVNEDGTIDYVLSYYNGGCGFNEAIECALENLER